MKQPLIHPQDFAELQHLLPPAFGEIVQLIGLENAFVLVKNYGGTSFKIGKNKNRYGKILHFALAEVIGEDAACAVEKHMAGLRELNIPKCEAVLREMRNRQIRREFDELTGREPPYRMGVMLAAQNLARAYNLTQRQWQGRYPHPGFVVVEKPLCSLKEMITVLEQGGYDMPEVLSRHTPEARNARAAKGHHRGRRY